MEYCRFPLVPLATRPPPATRPRPGGYSDSTTTSHRAWSTTKRAVWPKGFPSAVLVRLDRSAGSRVGDGVDVQPPSLPHSRRFDPRLLAEGGWDRLGPVRSEPDLGPVVQDQTVRPAPAGLVPAPHHARYRLSWPNPRRSPADEDGLGPGLDVSAVASSTLLPRTSISLASMALILAAKGKAVCRSADSGSKRWRAEVASLGIITSDQRGALGGDSGRRYSPRCHTSAPVGVRETARTGREVGTYPLPLAHGSPARL